MTKQEQIDTEKKVVEAVEATNQDNSLIKLSTGVVLKGKAAPSLALIKVMAAFKRPEVPTFRHEASGRDIPHPDDPDYRNAVQAYEATSSAAMLNTLIIYGTEVYSIPKKFPKPDDNSWLEKYEALGMTAQPNNKIWRFLNWVLFEAAPHPDDMKKIQEVVGGLSGVPESDAQSAEEFPGGDSQ